MATFDPTSLEVLSGLRRRYPDAPFLALGQTIWWDEPVKAVLSRMLEKTGLGGELVFGVHDTDYFARARPRRVDDQKFALLPHNDGSTRELWSAAGEISTLFGSETFPSRHVYREHGVPLKSVLRARGDHAAEFLDEQTEAWGWRGLVYSGSRDLVMRDLPLDLLGDSVERLLEWGFTRCSSRLVDSCCREEAVRLAAKLIGEAKSFRETNPRESLCALYRHLAPRLFSLLLGEDRAAVEITCTSDLLRLAPETAHLPRFELLGFFLSERTRAKAAQAYNEAVSGTEIYTLDRFGLGALPFDVISPSIGRGTLRVTLRHVQIESRRPVRIPLKEPIETVSDLARVLGDHLGETVVVVGKAVALVSMLAREFIFVFNEEGSGYVRHTRRMNEALLRAGIEHRVHPILRMRYHTWDSLSVGQSTLSLPDHLASALGVRQIPSADFAARWKQAVQEQRDLLEAIRQVRGPLALTRFLARWVGEDWAEKRASLAAASDTLRSIHNDLHGSRSHVRSLYVRLREVRARIQEVEGAKGDHFRSTVEWNAETTAERDSMTARIAELSEQRRNLVAEVRAARESLVAAERSGAAAKARTQIAEISLQAEARRMSLIRNAVLTITGLEHTNHRPSAWWLPMVDPAGRWFERITETAHLYLEAIA